MLRSDFLQTFPVLEPLERRRRGGGGRKEKRNFIHSISTKTQKKELYTHNFNKSTYS